MTVKVGVISRCIHERERLRQLVDEAGLQLIVSAAQIESTDMADEGISLWIVDVADTDACDGLDQLQNSHAAILIKDEKIAGNHTEQRRAYSRILEKLKWLIFSECQQKHVHRLAEPEAVWVLGASLGGPAAVGKFLSRLPPLPIAFIYIQHIESGYERHLIDSLNSLQKNYHVCLANDVHELRSRQVSVISSAYQIGLLKKHYLMETAQPWTGQYSPSIDQVTTEIAHCYRDKAGLIIFSGTCEDGVVGARMIEACNGQVWIQSTQDCVADDMPKAIQRNTRVDFEGAPEQLAEALVQLFTKPNLNVHVQHT